KMEAKEVKKRVPEICFEFQEAVVEVLTAKTIRAAKKFGAKTVMLSGGVAANRRLREKLEEAARRGGFEFSVPEFKLCTDNAAMAAIAGYYLSLKSKPRLDEWKRVKADPNWELT
ncbi:MAG: tRNA (adenosine(37)-N6)-threonylcarbamoyltransferase complex transferase subunit TsaD, partial [Patescibacteria group bacterium]